jgi:hypothetical protein
MKNLLIGLCILGLTNLNYSQNLVSELEATGGIEAKYSSIPLSRTVSLLNIPYLHKVQNKIKPSNIRQLELMAFKYNIKKIFKPSSKLQKLVIKFIWSKNYIIVKYDQDGKILSTYEEFKDFELPKYVLKSISLDYPNWSIASKMYQVHYSSKSGIKMKYIVKIRKGNLRKRIKIDVNDSNYTKYSSESIATSSSTLKLPK